MHMGSSSIQIRKRPCGTCMWSWESILVASLLPLVTREDLPSISGAFRGKTKTKKQHNAFSLCLDGRFMSYVISQRATPFHDITEAGTCLKRTLLSQIWQHTPVILALGKSLQKNSKFKVIFGYVLHCAEFGYL